VTRGEDSARSNPHIPPAPGGSCEVRKEGDAVELVADYQAAGPGVAPDGGHALF